MDFTCEISKAYGVTPFEILKQDKDEVIMLVNYFSEKGEEKQGKTQKNGGRVRVNDSTATGGWF